MKRIFVDILNHMDRIPDLNDILAKEFAQTNEWKAKGILNHLFVKSDNTGALLVIAADDIDKGNELVATLPMFSYFEKIDYSYIDEEF